MLTVGVQGVYATGSCMTQHLMWWCLGSALVAVVCAVMPPNWLRGNPLLTLLMLLCVATALTCSALAVALRTYTTLALEAPVATLTCEPFAGTPPHFRVHYTPHDAAAVAPQTFELLGDQWMVSGDFLKWHPWLTVLGFRPVHKLTRLSGRFASAAQERAQPPTVVELNGGTDAVWTWLHRHGARLPLIEAVYGNGVFTFAEPGRTYTIYATPSGYLVK